MKLAVAPSAAAAAFLLLPRAAAASEAIVGRDSAVAVAGGGEEEEIQRRRRHLRSNASGGDGGSSAPGNARLLKKGRDRHSDNYVGTTEEEIRGRAGGGKKDGKKAGSGGKKGSKKGMNEANNFAGVAATSTTVSATTTTTATTSTSPKETTEATEGAEQALGLLEKHQAFADNLANALHVNDNDFTSTWGVSMMLALLHPGSKGNTAEQMCDILGFSCLQSGSIPSNELAWSDIATELDAAYDGQCVNGFDGECYGNAPTLEVGNSVWIDEGRQLIESYETAVGDFLKKTNFSDDGAGDVLNDWVEESTNGLIDSIINRGPIDYDLVAINSIYLNASWDKPFLEIKTSEDSFYPNVADRDLSSAIPSHFMHKVEYMLYSHEALPGFQVIKMNYKASNMSMLVALPMSDEVGAVNTSDIVSATSGLTETKVALALPKFKFESTYGGELKTALKNLGLTTPFEVGFGFCGMFESSCPFLSLVKQKTYINIHELGTEAAAVTLGAVVTGIPPPEDPILVLADHPFLFLIYDESEDLVLFEGRVGAPEIPEGSSAKLSGAKHAEGSAFWENNFGESPIIISQYESSVPPQTTDSPSQPTPRTSDSNETTYPPIVTATSSTETTAGVVTETTTSTFSAEEVTTDASSTVTPAIIKPDPPTFLSNVPCDADWQCRPYSWYCDSSSPGCHCTALHIHDMFAPGCEPGTKACQCVYCLIDACTYKQAVCDPDLDVCRVVNKVVSATTAATVTTSSLEETTSEAKEATGTPSAETTGTTSAEETTGTTFTEETTGSTRGPDEVDPDEERTASRAKYWNDGLQ